MIYNLSQVKNKNKQNDERKAISHSVSVLAEKKNPKIHTERGEQRADIFFKMTNQQRKKKTY